MTVNIENLRAKKIPASSTLFIQWAGKKLLGIIYLSHNLLPHGHEQWRSFIWDYHWMFELCYWSLLSLEKFKPKQSNHNFRKLLIYCYWKLFCHVFHTCSLKVFITKQNNRHKLWWLKITNSVLTAVSDCNVMHFTPLRPLKTPRTSKTT